MEGVAGRRDMKTQRETLMRRKQEEMFSRRLRELLQETGTKQKELAKAVGMTEVTVSRWVNGSRVPRGGPLTRVADYFGVPANYLMPTEAGLRAEYEGAPRNGFNRVVTMVRTGAEKWTPWQNALLIRMLARVVEKQTRGEESENGRT